MHSTWIPNADTVRWLYDALCYVSNMIFFQTIWLNLVSINFICALISWFSNFSILDDMEMYEHQDPFKLTDFITMSYFLNQFLYKAVLTNLFGKSISVIFCYCFLLNQNCKKKNRKQNL